MAKFVDLTHNVTVTDGGVTAIDPGPLTHTREVDEVTQGTLRINAGQDKFICVAGVEGTEVSPTALGLVKIRGYLLGLDQPVEIREDGANPGVQRGPGFVVVDNTTLDSIKVVNGGALAANIKYIIWGDR